MILVAMCHEKRAHCPRKTLKCPNIWVHDIDSKATIVKRHTAIDEKDVPSVLKRETIHPNFAKASEGQNGESSVGHQRIDGTLSSVLV